MSQNTLYQSTLVAVTKQFTSAKDVINKVDDQIVSITFTKPYTQNIAGVMSVSYTPKFKIEFEFKDGKIRVNAPTIISITRSGKTCSIRDCLLSRDGRITEENIKPYLCVNEIINNILFEVNKKVKDDW